MVLLKGNINTMKLNKRIQQKKILVIGDAMLDVYSVGEVKRISPEAPVPIFKKNTEHYVLGGASNVAANLISAGQCVYLMTVVGNDVSGNLFMEMLHDVSINSEMIYRSEKRRTTVKNRFIASNNQQVIRLDEEDAFPLSDEESIELKHLFKERLQEFDLIILSDYLKGVLTHELTREIIDLANAGDIRVLVDPKDSEVRKYACAFLLKPNQEELCVLTGHSVYKFNDIIKTSIDLCEICDCRYILTTCGARGMVLTERGGKYEIFHSTPKEVYDVTGAGDTVIAYLGACLANGFTVAEAVFISNIAAGIKVLKTGTAPVYLNEVDDWNHKKWDNSDEHKIIDRFNISHQLKTLINKKIVFTNGCFDILHYGHVNYLRNAAILGDILIVGLNSDASVKRLKGKDRPINPQDERALLLAAFEFVDYVVIFDEDTPYELIRDVKPDILVKGMDYLPEDVIGRELVEARGGKLVLLPLVEGKSTTTLIEKIFMQKNKYL